MAYLYSIFVCYNKTGKPPFRALVCDYTNDTVTYDIDDEYMLGDALLIAPIYDRRVYFPESRWYDFWTHKVYESGWYDIKSDKITVFIKENVILPIL
ncbi:hypothetical protein [Ructibacterium gallinarum]|uniref:Glycosyl hydrolase family 31 C-terminal domain-containing protein n=1 Tax=Ructibacterium gallinarum TaxID=2779355 RepID=A0A9D5LZE9_9FIRM|nr:hypothetical protein [Ructibacterium gallinarum]